MKKLEEEQQNLTRVNDILSELTRQLAPLERQSETARIYLKKKGELKKLDTQMFLVEMNRIRNQLKEVDRIAQSDLEETCKSLDVTKSEYEKLEQELEELEQEIQRPEKLPPGKRWKSRIWKIGFTFCRNRYVLQYKRKSSIRRGPKPCRLIMQKKQRKSRDTWRKRKNWRKFCGNASIHRQQPSRNLRKLPWKSKSWKKR